MKQRVVIWGGMCLILLSMVSTSEARSRRACRVWNYGTGYQCCWDAVAHQACSPPVARCAFREVECEILVPQTNYETRKINVTEYHRELQERTVTVYRNVPRTEVKQVQYTVCEPVVREREIPYVSCRPVWEEKQVEYTYSEPVYEQREATRTVYEPVWEDVTREYTVMVPHQEWHTGTRMVCRWEPVTETRTVCVDEGHWEESVICPAPVCAPCGPCGPGFQGVCRPIVRRYWKPQITEREVPCTVYRPVQEPVEFQYCTTVFKPEVKTYVQKVCRHEPREVPYTYTTCRWEPKVGVRTVRVCKYVRETHSRTVNYTEWVPRTETRDVEYTVYDCVPEERKIQVPVCVPVQVEKEIQVAVREMVPKTITRRIPVTPACCLP